MKRPRRNHSAAFKAKVALARSRSNRRWRSCPSDLTCTPVRSRNGKTNCCSDLRRLCWSNRLEASSAAPRRRETKPGPHASYARERLTRTHARIAGGNPPPAETPLKNPENLSKYLGSPLSINSALYRFFGMEKALLGAFNFLFGVSPMAQSYSH